MTITQRHLDALVAIAGKQARAVIVTEAGKAAARTTQTGNVASVSGHKEPDAD